MSGVVVRRLGARMLVAAVVAVSMSVSVVPAAHAAGSTHPAAAGAVSPGPRLSGEAGALARAKSTGHPVPVAQETTATDMVTANPQGTLTLSQSVVPVRKFVGGMWQPLDATLHRAADGTVSPAVTTGGLSLSGGGDGPMVTLRAAGRQLAVSFPVRLPAPRMSGDTAVYADVLPGVDLQVTADAQGSAGEVLIVHDAAAAANPMLQRLALGVRAPGLTVAAGPAGDITVSNPGGHVVFSAPTPFMWDSAPPAQAGPAATGMPPVSSAAGPGAGARREPVGVAVTGGAIVLSPDRSMLTSPAVRFPVYIDPTFTAPSAGSSASGWNTVNDAFPTTSNWKTSVDLQVGYNGWSSPFFKARSFVQLPVPTKLYGSTIISAQLNVVEEHAPSCTATPVQAWLTGAISSGTTWNNQPGWSTELSSQTVAHGYDSTCPAAGVGFNVASAIVSAANNRWTQVTFGLRAGDESDEFGWKEFSVAVNSMTMSVTYDHPPATPTKLSTSPSTVCSAATPTVVGDGNVSLYVPVSDPDGGTLGVTLQMWKTATGTAFAGTPTNPQNLFVSSGGTAVFVAHKADLEAAAAGAVTEFSWKAQATDYKLTSSWSVTCNFTFDATRPAAPAVTVPDSATIGQQATVTVAPPDGGTIPAGYAYQLNTDPPQTVPADASGNATIVVTPKRFANQLTVTGLSAAGNYGVPAVSPVFFAVPEATAADADMTGDGKADLLAVGGTGMPAGLWLASGHGDGTVTTQASDFGAEGNGTTGDGSPADFTGAQAITGHFTGSGFQDVLAYYPTGANAGQANILFGTGDGSAVDPVSGAEQTIEAGTLADFNNDNPLQLADAGDTQGLGYPWPDLIGINGDATNGYYLDFIPDANGFGAYQNPVVLTTATPSGGTDWNNWQVATAQLASGTAMYLWDASTGALYLWVGLQYNATTNALTYTQYIIADGSTSHWNQGAAITLHAGDINGDGTPDLWAVTGSGVVTASLATLGSGTAALAAQKSQTLLSSTHTWALTDGTSGSAASAADTTGAPALALTGSGSATWNTGDVFSPDVSFDGTAGGLAASGPAVTTNSGGFTVSVWAAPNSIGGTVVSQDMTKTAGFKISSTTAGAPPGIPGVWSFCLADADTTSATYACGTGGVAQVGVWSHLTATYDPSTTVAKLYQDTTNIASFTRPALSGVTDGPLQVGNDLKAGSRSDYFDGQVSGVQTWSRVIAPEEVSSPDGYFKPMTPTRIMDTRSGLGGSGSIPANGISTLTVAGAGGVPSTGVLAVAATVTVVNSTSSGDLRVYPDREPIPATSNINYASGVNIANTTIVPVGPDGKIALLNIGAAVGALVDVSGYFTSDASVSGASTLTPMVPTRILDTRSGLDAPKAVRTPGSTLAVPIGGVSGIPQGVTAVAITLTTTGASASGYLTAYPDGVTRPGTDVSLFGTATQSAMAIVPVGADGKIDVYDYGASVDLIGDVSGYFTAGTGGQAYHAIGATRLVDTRQHAGALASGGTMAVGPGAAVDALNPTLVLNVAAISANASGWLIAYPGGVSRPTADTVSYAANQTIAGLAVAKSGGGTVDISNSGSSSQILVDCFGYFSAG